MFIALLAIPGPVPTMSPPPPRGKHQDSPGLQGHTRPSDKRCNPERSQASLTVSPSRTRAHRRTRADRLIWPRQVRLQPRHLELRHPRIMTTGRETNTRTSPSLRPDGEQGAAQQ